MSAGPYGAGVPRRRPPGRRGHLVGQTVTLPDPVGIELDTEPLTNWARRPGAVRQEPGTPCG
ncbi:hypothetical protein ACFV0K_21760, partial [Streptomyces sp. NPDC059586]